MKNSYEKAGKNSFELGYLHSGEVAVIIKKFAERKIKGEDAIELTAELLWTAHDEDKVYCGNEFPILLVFNDNCEITVRIWKTCFAKSGFQVQTWTVENKLPFTTMFPGTFKLLADKNCVLMAKVSKTVSAQNKQEYTNFTPVVLARKNPCDGVEYLDALPEKVDNQWILDVVDKEDESDGSREKVDDLI